MDSLQEGKAVSSVPMNNKNVTLLRQVLKS